MIATLAVGAFVTAPTGLEAAVVASVYDGHMVQIDEETGELGKIADFYEDEVDTAIPCRCSRCWGADQVAAAVVSTVLK